MDKSWPCAHKIVLGCLTVVFLLPSCGNKLPPKPLYPSSPDAISKQVQERQKMAQQEKDEEENLNDNQAHDSPSAHTP